MHFTLCDMFSDLTQNAVEAGSRVISVELVQTPSDIRFKVEDNGKGMTAEQVQKATDPFYTDGIKHPGRKIGLGIPFLIQTVESTGGTWNIRSVSETERADSHGTVLEARFDLNNIDTPPVGDVTGFFRHVLSFDGRYEMIITRRQETDDPAKGTEYSVRRSELLQALGLDMDGSFSDANALLLLGQFLESMEDYNG